MDRHVNITLLQALQWAYDRRRLVAWSPEKFRCANQVYRAILACWPDGTERDEAERQIIEHYEML